MGKVGCRLWFVVERDPELILIGFDCVGPRDHVVMERVAGLSSGNIGPRNLGVSVLWPDRENGVAAVEVGEIVIVRERVVPAREHANGIDLTPELCFGIGEQGRCATLNREPKIDWTVGGLRQRCCQSNNERSNDCSTCNLERRAP